MFASAWEVTRRAGVAVILVNAVLMYAGFFMLIPFVSLYGTRELGLTAAAVGLVLATRIVVQQGLTMFGGIVADSVGYKPILAAGIFIRTIGFTLFAFTHDFTSLLLAAVVAALGGALFEATHKAALASFVPPRERAIAFSLVSTVGRIGTMLGPLIAVALLPIGFATLSLVSAACYVVAFTATVLFLPATRAMSKEADGEAASQRRGGWAEAVQVIPAMFRLVWADKPFVVFTALTAGYWFIFSQIFLTLPLYVSYLSGSDNAVGSLLAVNSAFALVAQYPIIAWVGRRAAALPIIIGGCGVMTIGLGLFSLGTGIPANGDAGLFVAVLSLPVILYALGDLLVQPTLSAITSDLARPEALGSYFGFSSFGIALGGGIGNALGGWLFDQSRLAGLPNGPWYLYSGLAALLALAFYGYGRVSRASLAQRMSEGSSSG